MTITIYTGERYHEYDLNKHQIQVEDGNLFVRALPKSIYENGALVALFAKGEWKRVEFDRD